MRVLYVALECILRLVHWLPTILTDNQYLGFNTSSDSFFEFTGVATSFTIYSPDNSFKLGFDVPTAVLSSAYPKDVVHAVSRLTKKLYIKGVSGSGYAHIVSTNITSSKSDQQLQDEAFVRKS